MLTEPDAGQRIKHPVVSIGRIRSQQLLHLLLSLLVHVAFAEDLRVIESSSLVLGREVQNAFQQKLRVVQDVAFDANAGQEPHCLDVMPVFEQEGRG